MITNGSWTVNSFVHPDPIIYEQFANGDRRQVFRMDWNNDGVPAPVTSSIEIVLVMNNQTVHPEHAWTFIDYMVNDGQQLLIDQFLMYKPSVNGMEINVQGLGDLGQENLDFILELGTQVGGFREIPYPGLQQAIAGQLQALATGETTPEQATEVVENASQTEAR